MYGVCVCVCAHMFMHIHNIRAKQFLDFCLYAEYFSWKESDFVSKILALRVTRHMYKVCFCFCWLCFGVLTPSESGQCCQCFGGTCSLHLRGWQLVVEGRSCPVNLGESLKIQVVWYVMLCHWMNSSQCFGGSQGLHPQGQAVQEEWFLFVCLILKMHLLRSFEMLGITVSTLQDHILEYLQLQQDYSENLIWHGIVSVMYHPVVVSFCSLWPRWR